MADSMLMYGVSIRSVSAENSISAMSASMLLRSANALMPIASP